MAKPTYTDAVTVERPGPRLRCVFFRQEDGSEPVRKWLLVLGTDVRKQIGSDLMDVQWRWPVGEPLVGAFGDGLYEVRTTCCGNEYRVLFTVVGNSLLDLYGFQKKTRTTPKRYINIARSRMP